MIPYPIYQQQPQQAATPFPGMPNYGQPAYGQPTFAQPPQTAIAQPSPQPYMPPQVPAGNGGWQPGPVLAAQALATNQPKARGYSPDPTPTTLPLTLSPFTPSPAATASPPTPHAGRIPLRLPSPEDLGVGPAAPDAPAPAVVDWNRAHARMRELGVVRFGITRVDGGVRISMELPGGRVVNGLGATESSALESAFESAAR